MGNDWQSRIDAADLARRLSPAMRRTLRMIEPGTWATSLKGPLSQRSCRALAASGLLESRTFETKWRLTPLGERVRDAIED